jgi:hypothetical protein
MSIDWNQDGKTAFIIDLNKKIGVVEYFPENKSILLRNI